MGIISRIEEAIGQRYMKRFYNENKIKDKLPFVHLFGTEKSYGAIPPDDFTGMVEGYKSWAYACAWKNAVSVAKCNLRLYKQKIVDNEIVLDVVGEHPFLDVINSVNPFSNRFELMTITTIFLEMTGNAYWWIPRDRFGIPYMIWNIPAHWVKIIPSKTKYIEGYLATIPGKGEKVPFDESEVIHFKYPSPFNLFYGTGPYLAAAGSMAMNNAIIDWGNNYFLNNAEPSGVLMVEGGMTDEQYQRFRDAWNRKHRGTKNAGKMAILENGMKYERVGTTAKDAKVETISRENRDQILAIFGVPASKLGLVEDVNRANADTNDYTFQKETILPKLKLIEEKINEKFIPIYDRGLLAKFDNPVPEDFESKLKERQINIASGFSSIDEEREKEGLDPYNLPETKVPLIPFSLNPAGEEKPEMDSFGLPKKEEENEKSIKAYSDKKWKTFVTATEPQERILTKIIQRYFQSQHGEVMRNINKIKSITKDLASFVLFNTQEQNEKLRNLTNNNIRQAFLTGLTLGMQETGSAIDFTLFEPNIARAVEERLDFFVERVGKSTVKLLTKEINTGLTAGESIERIAQRIDKVFQYSRDFRSRRIAQTEVIGATNSGQIRAYLEAGITGKEWVTAGDELVRDSHRIDGQQVGITETFQTGMGSHLQYPGDRSSGAPASDIINCRCTVLPVKRG